MTVKYNILKKLLDEAVSQAKPEAEGKLSANSIVRAIFQAHISSFKLLNAHEVVETLLSSDRVITDEVPSLLFFSD